MRSDEAVLVIDACTDHCVHPETVRHVRARALPENDLVQVSAVFKLLGDPTRAKLLYALLEAGELCVCDLAAATVVAETTVSQSLRLLRASQVVTARRDGRLMYYRLADAHVRMLLDLTREHMTHEHTATQPAPVEHVEPTTAQSVTSRVSTRRAASTRTGASA
ncbi:MULTISPECIES: ArsR/SmtB family transcription factor [Arsenicicoccus]|uniref:Metalloregulator ArsR/SmtB family transcription factor n=1 Tax=Arsenicicoccus bolidensis TaxID=229480 RepID=A0ABS9Q6I2_9MICO|nr:MULTISPECIES: metalloregulator ArsR/SmtB family transcription factor [Arsenicicoccus]MCG7323489.1 metalloregulator ArsR/SmtB family transcription factor [Arsenicicoccus bolidensis]